MPHPGGRPSASCLPSLDLGGLIRKLKTACSRGAMQKVSSWHPGTSSEWSLAGLSHGLLPKEVNQSGFSPFWTEVEQSAAASPPRAPKPDGGTTVEGGSPSGLFSQSPPWPGTLSSPAPSCGPVGTGLHVPRPQAALTAHQSPADRWLGVASKGGQLATGKPWRAGEGALK